MIDKQWIVNLKGKDYPLYSGVLDAATRAGLKSLRMTIVQTPDASNGHTAIVLVRAEFEDGRLFESVGDASPANCSPQIATAALRMAETRAAGRAMRNAINCGQTMREELPDDECLVNGNGHQAASQPRQRAAYDPEDNQARKAAGEAAAGLCEDCGNAVPAPVAAASRKRFDAVLCINCGKARKDAANGTPAQLQGA